MYMEPYTQERKTHLLTVYPFEPLKKRRISHQIDDWAIYPETWDTYTLVVAGRFMHTARCSIRYIWYNYFDPYLTRPSPPGFKRFVFCRSVLFSHMAHPS